jgi:hypothetical protein
MAAQYARAVGYALMGLVYLRRRGRPGPIARARAVFRLSLATLRMAFGWRQAG